MPDRFKGIPSFLGRFTLFESNVNNSSEVTIFALSPQSHPCSQFDALQLIDGDGLSFNKPTTNSNVVPYPIPDKHPYPHGQRVPSRLAVVFLAFDVFFAIFCVALACMIGIALCCCLPCIIAILYAVAGQEGATESDLSILPRYKYQISGNEEKLSAGAGSMVPIATPGADLTDERVLLPEDAECCICLSSYEDGQELHALTCGHHFHSACIVKWLKINASCPLCKYNILKGTSD
ncbi:hypothetical protein GIB67_020876 [Kingdonia uniflora]|uniref:RING-type E3 ubiquitin transferase n=1 Tax=Kingdonia uniflora TaxID=39325 RepID=A0A7J7M7E4_9MAGN|nr:hypothetical protein GIB67_020876 [Kingdonia uniflora]